jgi:HD superfamily phosphodiesterase
VLWVAAHLHDWGAYHPWASPETDHCLRSCDVAGAFLKERGFPEEMSAHIIECIRLHHAPGADRSLEAAMLRDADALDFLGVVGVLRNFAINPRDLHKAYQETIRRRDRSLSILTLDRSHGLAAGHVVRMNALLAEFESETCGLF